MCGFYCIVFIGYMFVGKTLLDYTNFFAQNDCKNNDQIIYIYIYIYIYMYVFKIKATKVPNVCRLNEN